LFSPEPRPANGQGIGHACHRHRKRTDRGLGAHRDVHPKLLGFLAILIIGYFVAKRVARVVDGLLERIGFDRWVERGALKTALDRFKFDASDILSVVAFWAVFLISLQLAFGVFGPNPVSDLIQGIIAYLPNLFAAVVILVIVAALAKVVTDLLAAALGEVSVANGSPVWQEWPSWSSGSSRP
jgi:hypothetical protein